MLSKFLSIPIFPLVVLILVFGAFVYQLAIFLCNSGQEWRRWRVLLMMFLIVYDLLVCLIPDDTEVFPLNMPYAFRYGLDFAIWSCIPLYFVKVHGLSGFSRHIRLGVPICFVFPYLLFLMIGLTMGTDLKTARFWTMIIPSSYLLLLFFVLGIYIREILADNKMRHLRQNLDELFFSCIAVAPVILVVGAIYLDMGRWWEICCGNVGVLMGWFLVLNRDIRLKLVADRLSQHVVVEEQYSFTERCLAYNLTKREVEVAELLCLGLTYREIGDQLYISEHTVDNHVRHIFAKVGVKRKIELLSKLRIESAS